MIKEKWQQLSSKDQKTLKVGGLVLVILFFIQWIWWPLFSRISSLQAQIQKEGSLHAWMAPRVAQIIELKEEGGSAPSEKSLPAIERALQEMGLKPYVTQLSQNAQGQVIVHFSEVPFEASLEWLTQIQRQGWVVESMRAQKGEESGLVELEFVLI